MYGLRKGRDGVPLRMKLVSLGSGSTGNCLLVRAGDTKILVDAGLSLADTQRRLAAAGESLAGLSAICVTHEHTDHVAGLEVLARHLYRSGAVVPILCSPGTAAKLPRSFPNVQAVASDEEFNVGAIEVEPFPVPHDAVQPFGWLFSAAGIKAAVAIDLGSIPPMVAFRLLRSHLLFIESNHDADMLRVGPYHWRLKERVAAPTGHLSNETVAGLLARLDGETQHVILAHLSVTNNVPELARMAAEQALQGAGLPALVHLAGASEPLSITF